MKAHTQIRRDDRGTIVKQSAPAESGPPYALRAVERVCDILDILANSNSSVSLSEVAEGTGMPKSSAFRYLTVLEGRHYVERDPETSSFRLGLAFRPQNTRAVEMLTELARPALEKLRDQLGETTNLGVLDGAYVVHTAVAESPHIMRLAARVGDRGYIHSTALGKAICAELPEDRVRSILSAAGMPALTDSTITSVDSYLTELKRVRTEGFGEDDAENQPAGRCVAVVIRGTGLPAGISVSAPADRFPREQVADTVKQLRKVARSLSRQMRD
ncbi:IclR family transcriptional regulator [Planosporangium thailandense]|uniref:IclR family transcriptional regulator n=1 Tax=Planosporangium thailandense TaxID=765197 RepID=A0ABX0Y6N4_9ACTN|nr:IclR family transcriptional regulator [Planosporangium thailandense]NJC72949.1 IclR family transcriptional regulator [Planosporangium thailandense]